MMMGMRMIMNKNLPMGMYLLSCHFKKRIFLIKKKNKKETKEYIYLQ